MGQMSEKQLAWRKRQVMQAIAQVAHHYQNPEHLHRRSYDKGDMQCNRCKKWLNPNKPEEIEEIKYGKGGKKYHKKCPVYSPYSANLVMYSKFRPTRSKRVENVKRY